VAGRALTHQQSKRPKAGTQPRTGATAHCSTLEGTKLPTHNRSGAAPRKKPSGAIEFSQSGRAGWRCHKQQSWRRNNVCAPPSPSWRSSAHPATQLGSEPVRATRRLALTVARATSQCRRTVVAIVTCKTPALVRVWRPARRRLTHSVVAPTTAAARRASRRAATRGARPPSCRFGR
jgi:hypothetical protein